MVKRRARGELEAQVMDLLWDSDHALTPGDVQEAVSTPRHPIAYNTAMTILVRLWQKGMVERQPAGRGFVYRPVAPREEWTAERMQNLLRSASNTSLALQHFVSGMSPREAAALRRALGHRKRS